MRSETEERICVKANYDFNKGERGKFYHKDAELILPDYTESGCVPSAQNVWFDGDILSILLDDSRTISVDLARVAWLKWLRNAPSDQREQWSVEPGGFAVYWGTLDDGIEISHLLGMQPV